MPTAESRVLSSIGRWGTADVTDPRPMQLIFTVLLLADWSVQLDDAGARDLGTLGAALAVTVLSCVVPWPRWSSTTTTGALAALAVADLVLLGVYSAGTPTSTAVVLVGMPALWLGRLGYRGVVLCAVTGAVGIVLPALLESGAEPWLLVRAALPALVAVLATTAKAAAVERERHERRVMSALVETVDVGLQLVDNAGRTLRSNGRVPSLALLTGPQGQPLPGGASPVVRAARGELFDGLLVAVDDPTRSVFSVSARPVSSTDGTRVAAALAWQDVTPLVETLDEDRHLLATVSHDLRTPLTAIRGYVELLELQPLPPAAASMVAVIKKSSQRIEFLIGDLVVAAEARRANKQIEPRRVDVVELVRAAVAAIQPLADAASVAIAVDGPAELMFDLDPDRMVQVVDNLLSNAIKYNAPGGQVDVTLAADAARMRLTISDTGLGMAADEHDRIFGRRYRVLDPRTETQPGSGLGLAIVKDIVEAHRGTIEVVSRPGDGSTFTISLPR